MKFHGRTTSYTLSVIPDSGYDIKTGSIDVRLVLGGLGVLSTVFVLCLFFIIGYHVKLHHENGYRLAVSTMNRAYESLETHTRLLEELDSRIGSLKTLDQAFRRFAAMQVPDDGMYQAGIGGHIMVDDTKFDGLNQHLSGTVTELLRMAHALDSKVRLESRSLGDIQDTIEARNELIDNTPSILPTQSLHITSGFGNRINPVTGQRQFHDAVDFTGHRGDKIYATAHGTVIKAEFHSVRGYYVLIQHKHGYQTLYAHLDAILVNEGQQVRKRDVIGTMGRTGRATGVNLHYSVSHNNRKVNPLNYF